MQKFYFVAVLIQLLLFTLRLIDLMAHIINTYPLSNPHQFDRIKRCILHVRYDDYKIGSIRDGSYRKLTNDRSPQCNYEQYPVLK